MNNEHCCWVSSVEVSRPLQQIACAYRLRFEQFGQETIADISVTADEQYILYLDGVYVGRGPELGMFDHWCYESFKLALTPGPHSLVAIVWSMGESSSLNRTSLAHGFFMSHQTGCPEDDLSTGVAAWEHKTVPGVRFVDLSGRPPHFYAIGADTEIDGRLYPHGLEKGMGDDWRPVVKRDAAVAPHSEYGETLACQQLLPAILPALLEDRLCTGHVRYVQRLHADDWSTATDFKKHSPEVSDTWQLMLEGREVVEIPPQSRWRILIDFDDYHNGYSELEVSGGLNAQMTIRWAEALYTDETCLDKGNRDEVDGKYFRGPGDRFIAGGKKSEAYSSLNWRAGRYWLLEIETESEALRVLRVQLRIRSRANESETEFISNDERLNGVCTMSKQTLAACSDDTYMDCPHYEQLMYSGDARIEMLIDYILHSGALYQKKALKLFADSIDASGMIASRSPSRLRQVIPPFGFLWILTVHDYGCWRDDDEGVRSLLPAVRKVIDYGINHLGSNGLLSKLPGWIFIDWVPDWERGVAPGVNSGESSILNCLFILALEAAADLESSYGDDNLAARCLSHASAVATIVDDVFWNSTLGLYADQPDHLTYSEHTQSLRILSKHLPIDKHARIADALSEFIFDAHCTLYFSHYFLEACHRIGLAKPFYSRLAFWYSLKEQGLKTTPENENMPRSDCHAWSSHPLYHAHASILGIRPAGLGFSTVSIKPMPGELELIQGSVPHPQGSIYLSLEREGAGWRATVELPVSGVFEWSGESYPLKPGVQILHLDGYFSGSDNTNNATFLKNHDTH